MLVAAPNKGPEDAAGVFEDPNEKVEAAGFDVEPPNGVDAAFDVPPNKLPPCDAPDAGVALPNKEPPAGLFSEPAVAVFPNKLLPLAAGAEDLGVEPKLQLGFEGFIVSAECRTTAPCSGKGRKESRNGWQTKLCATISELESVGDLDAWKTRRVELEVATLAKKAWRPEQRSPTGRPSFTG